MSGIGKYIRKGLRDFSSLLLGQDSQAMDRRPIEYGRNQTDIPHLMDFTLEKRPECRLPVENEGGEPAIYGADACSFAAKDGFVEKVTLCPQPHFWSSGAHRVLLQGVYRNNEFVVAIEEAELTSPALMPIGCGEIVYLGLDEEICRDDFLDFLKFLALSVTGQELYLQTFNRERFPMRPYYENIKVIHQPMEQILSDGCSFDEKETKKRFFEGTSATGSVFDMFQK